MQHTCKNCDNQFEGNFCNQCGQEAGVQKINLRFIGYDLQQGLLNFDSGMLYTIKELFTRPGYSIREFIEGKRVHHFKPVSLVVILATVYAFIHHYFGMHLFTDLSSNQDDIAHGAMLIYDFFEDQYSLFILLSIPFLAVCTFVLFRSRGYSFAENLVIITFVSAQRLVVSLVMFPLLYIFEGDYPGKTAISTLISVGLYCWVFVQLFWQMKKWKVILLALASYCLGILLFTLIFVLAVFAF